MPCMPAWSTCPHASVPNVCQLFIVTCQRANKRANVPKVCQLFNLACQRAKGVPIFQFCLPKGVPIFQLFFKRIFQFLNFSVILTICKFQEYLGNSRKLNFDICKMSLRKNLANLKPLMSFSIEHVGLTEQLFD